MIIALVVACVLLVLGSGLKLLPGLGDLFDEKTTDRTGPTLLQSIQDLDRYEAALRTGNCLVMVHIHKTAQKNEVAQLFHHHNAHQVDYFGLAMTEHISEATSEASG